MNPFEIISSWSTTAQLFVYCGIVAIAILLLGIIIVKARKASRSGGESINLDTGFLDGLEGKGGLTAEEMKRVRQAMVRQALREQESKEGAAKSQNLDVNTLSLLAKDSPGDLRDLTTVETGSERTGAPKQSFAEQQQTEAQSAVPKKNLLSLDDIRRKEADLEEPPAEEKQESKKGSIDIDNLLERGLIDPAEYDRLKMLSEESER